MNFPRLPHTRSGWQRPGSSSAIPWPLKKRAVVDWVNQEFGAEWASECDVAFAKQPVSCIIAVQDGKLLGFACYDVTCKGFFGPTGVTAEARGQGVGRALLLAALHGLAEMGYAYAIIGGAGPVDFYQKTVGAIEIEGSVPGIYRDRLPAGDQT